MSEPEAPQDVVAFLNARLDDRERLAQQAAEVSAGTWLAAGSLLLTQGADGVFGADIAQVTDYRYDAALPHAAANGPARTLREVYVMRRVVRELKILSGMTLGIGPEMARLLLRNLAEIDEGHPDYRRWLPVAVPELPLARTGAEDEATARGFAQEAQAGLQYVMLPSVWGQRFSDGERGAAEDVRGMLLRELDVST